MTIKRNSIYRHYKGGLYKIVGTGFLEADLSEVVVYQSLHDSPDHHKGTLWVRTRQNFEEIIEREGKKMPRFTLEKKSE